MEVQELRPGLWRWTASHPQWDHAEHWGPDVGSVYAELPDSLVVVDPLVPADEDETFWSALDPDVERLALPLHVLLTVHWHERSVATVLDRYKAKLWRPEEKGELPAGVHAEVVKGSDWVEAVFFLEPHRALVAGDLLIGVDGGVELPVSWSGPSNSSSRSCLHASARFRSSSSSSRTASLFWRTAPTRYDGRSPRRGRCTAFRAGRP
jgi:hypothetical protein